MTASRDTNIIEVANLTKRYGQTNVVDEVSFGVRRGEVFGILGQNGAGKTTLVECLQGLRRATSGSVTVCGHDPLREQKRLAGRIGSQLQESALPDRLRVGEALRLFATPNALPVGDVLEQWGLSAQRKTAFANLSGGQQQRLFIALALQNKPEVVFLDELTQGLDPAARREVWELIRELRRGGTTVVLVTHFMDEAEAVCDRLAVMNAGSLVAAGSPADLIGRYSSPTEISFTVPEGIDPNGMFSTLPGLDKIAMREGRLHLSGQRSLVAHAGAALVGSGTVPDDIATHEPTLEEALLHIIGDQS